MAHRVYTTNRVGLGPTSGHGLKQPREQEPRMLTGELRSQIDAVWNAYWSGGISNPLEVMELITYMDAWTTRIDVK
jgi:hypothetical protein